MDFVDLEVDQFQLIFQVAKELPNIPDAEISRAGYTRTEADAIYNAATGIRDNLKGASLVRIRIENSDSLCEVALKGPSVGSPGLSIRRDLLDKWHGILAAAVAYLGGKELHHRTGYEEREVRAVIEKLRVASP